MLNLRRKVAWGYGIVKMEETGKIRVERVRRQQFTKNERLYWKKYRKSVYFVKKEVLHYEEGKYDWIQH